MNKITAPLYMCIYITLAVSQKLYPPSWEPFCDVFISKEFVNITCNLKPDDSEILKLKDLNEYSNNTEDNVKYSVYWKCSPNASISMRVTMQINKIYSMKVYGCRIVNYLDYWNHESIETVKDSLEYQEIVDCIIVVDFIQYLLILDNLQNLSNDLMCGHDTTLKESISRNISIYKLAIDLTDIQNYTDNEEIYNILKNVLTANSTDKPDVLRWAYLQSRINFYYQPDCDFQSLEVLEAVMMKSSHNMNLQQIFKSVKKEYPHMRVFNFSHNGYTMFPQEWKDNLYRFPKLEYIDYSYNFIADVSIDLNYRFAQPGPQIVLDLSYNNITTLTAETASKWTAPEDITFDIRGNPLDCGCSEMDFINSVQDDTFFDGKMQKYKYIQNMTCASPATAKGLQIITVSKAEMGCKIPTKYWIIPLALAFILIVLILCVFIFWEEIKFYMFVKFNILLECKKLPPGDVEKQYDAFVSYSETERKWVFDNLDELESQDGIHDALSLCIHDRDFLLGTRKIRNLHSGIEKCRHTILVLSRQFINDEWLMAEFEMVYNDIFIKNNRHLIIIKYEDIPEDEMDTMLKRCIRVYPYIDVKKSDFIDRLRFEVTKK